MAYVGIGVQGLLAVVFGWAAVGKLRAFGRVRRQVSELGLVPPALVGGTAVLLVGAELVCAITVAIPPLRVVGLVLASGLLVAFCCGITVVLRRGVRAQCACFGRSGEPLRPQHLVRNGLLLIVAVGGLVIAGTVEHAAVHGAGVAIAVGVGLVGAALVVEFDDLAELFSPAH